MTLLKRALLVIAGLIVVALLAGAIALSHTSACPVAGAPAAAGGGMKAIVYRCYGPPQVLKLEEIARPSPKANEVLVRVHAASVNPLDWHYMRGTPYIARMDAGLGAPQNIRFGVDFAGVVEAVGPGVTRFKPGDEVFGGRRGAFAEYLTVSEQRALAAKPANMSFAQAAAVPIAGLTALQGLRDKAHVARGQKVLINGASGGVGTFAVQIARSYGAEVTGVCSTRNVDLVRSLGADHVIDYTKEDFTKGDQKYDVIIDNVANRTLSENRRVLTPNGRYVLIGGGGVNEARWVGGLVRPIRALVLSWFISQKMATMLARLTKEDLTILGDL